MIHAPIPLRKGFKHHNKRYGAGSHGRTLQVIIREHRTGYLMTDLELNDKLDEMLGFGRFSDEFMAP